MINAVVRNYMDNCTAHGVSHLTSENKWHRLFWGILLFVAVFCFSGHVYILMTKYFRYDVIAQWDSSSPVVPKFPIITLCDAAHMSWERSKYTDVTSDGLTTTSDTIVRNLQNIWRVALGVEIDEIGQFGRGMAKIFRQSLQSMTVGNGSGTFWNHQKQDVIMKCFYNEQPCSFINFTQSWFPYYHQCVSFSPDDHGVSRGGENSGLNLIMFGNDRRAFLTDHERLNWFEGYYLILTEKGHFPFDENGVKNKIHLGYSTSIRFTQQYDKLAKEGKQSCMDTDTHVHFSYHDDRGHYERPGKYLFDTTACNVIKKQKLVLEKCGCFDDHYPIPADDPIKLEKNGHFWCHYISDHRFIFSQDWVILNQSHVVINDTFDAPVSLNDTIFVEARKRHNCLEEFRADILQQSDHLKCLHPCGRYHFKPLSRTFDWPSRMTYATNIQVALEESIQRATDMDLDTKVLHLLRDSNLADNISMIRRNFALVNIYPTTTSVMLMEEGLAYPVGNLLSDFGGTLGLWIGCSIVTVIEFLWFLSTILVNWRDDRKMKRDNAKNEYELQPMNIV